VQINADYYEDLTSESFERILDALAAGETPTPGPQNGRQFSAPEGGPTTLTDPAIYATAPHSRGPSVTDAEAKKPGDAANMREAGVPKPPVADSSNARRE
jgi:NADH-quinone oxidoreductase subunit E